MPGDEPVSKACDCKATDNHHRSYCQYKTAFFEQFVVKTQQYKKKTVVWEQGGKHIVCCCRPDLPHDEKLKFIPIHRDPFPDKKAGAPEAEYELEKQKHDEMEEFDKKIWNFRIFANREQNENSAKFEQLEVDKNRLKQLKTNIKSDNLFRRQVEIREIVGFLDAGKNKGKLLHVYGEAGLGKSDIVNHSATYVLEG